MRFETALDETVPGALFSGSDTDLALIRVSEPPCKHPLNWNYCIMGLRGHRGNERLWAKGRKCLYRVDQWLHFTDCGTAVLFPKKARLALRNTHPLAAAQRLLIRSAQVGKFR